MRVRVASAGTGKTTSLVRRYLELVGEGVPLRRIAGVTFTRDVAGELRQRVAAGLRTVAATGTYLDGLYRAGEDAHELIARAELELGGALLTTIHGFMIAGLRLSAPLLGYDPRFDLLPEWEADAVFQEELTSVLLVAGDPDHPLHVAATVGGPEAAAHATRLFELRSLAADLRFGDGPLDRAVAALYREAYARYLRRLGSASLAPGEVERAALRLLDSPTALARLARRHPLVLVDEYQDVNPLQGRVFERLAEAGVALEVVGDPKQSIYLFRSADVGVFRRALDAAEASGELLEPLTHTRRHSQAVVAFLNRLTGVLGAKGLGFDTREAPPVAAAGAQAAVTGSVEVIVAEGGGTIDRLRQLEAALLAERLERSNADGMAWRDMAVVARSRHLLDLVERVLTARGVPTLRLKGSAYYRRNEVRDVYHALRVGAEPTGSSLGAFLRGPLAGIGLAALERVLSSADPLSTLAEVAPSAAATVAELRRVALLPPLEAVKAVIRSPLAAGARLVDRLDARARDNVDALLFELAAGPPADLALLLDRLDGLAARADAADVPGGGDGVRLLTVHGSKGLEFRLVALFDTGAHDRKRSRQVLVDAADGRVWLHGSYSAPAGDAEAAAQAQQAERELQESYRLLYVAVSRARDTLVITGSAPSYGVGGWLELLLGQVLADDPPPGTVVTRAGHVAAPARTVSGAIEAAEPAPAPWIDQRFDHHRYEPLLSPSRLVGLLDGAVEPRSAEAAVGAGRFELDDVDDADEPLSVAELAGGAGGGSAPLGRLPGAGRVIGTLVHHAISHDWHPGGPLRSRLAVQEVMFPYAPAQQTALLDEVEALLAAYGAMLGSELPALGDRTDDRAEIPLAVRGGGTVWEGVVDRLYRVGPAWYLDDYKTDRTVRPERYHLQLGLYLHALERALGTRPTGRLVYLRSRTVVTPATEDLHRALDVSGILD